MQTMCVKGESLTHHIAEGRVDKVDVVVMTNKKKGVTAIICRYSRLIHGVTTLKQTVFLTPPPLQKTTRMPLPKAALEPEVQSVRKYA